MNGIEVADIILYTTLANLSLYAGVGFIARIRRKRHPTAVLGLLASIATGVSIAVSLNFFYDPSSRCRLILEQLAIVSLGFADLCIGSHFFLKSRILNSVERHTVIQLLLLLATGFNAFLPLYLAAVVGGPDYREYYPPTHCTVLAVWKLPMFVVTGQAVGHLFMDGISLAAFALPLYRMITRRKETGLRTAASTSLGSRQSRLGMAHEADEVAVSVHTANHGGLRGQASNTRAVDFSRGHSNHKSTVGKATTTSFGAKSISTQDGYIMLVRRSVLATAISFTVSLFVYVAIVWQLYAGAAIIGLEFVSRVLAALAALPLPAER